MKNYINQETFNLVKKFFNGDVNKTYLWFEMPNPNLGMLSPLEMINAGKSEKLNKFVKTSLEENYR